MLEYWVQNKENVVFYTILICITHYSTIPLFHFSNWANALPFAHI